MNKSVTLALLILLFLALIIVEPLVVIFCLNTLFPILSIPYSFSTWLATLLLNVLYFGSIRYYLSLIEKNTQRF